MNTKTQIATLVALAAALAAAPAFALDISDAGSLMDFWHWLTGWFNGQAYPHGGSPGSGIRVLSGPGIFVLVAIGLGLAIAMARRRQR